LFIKNLKGEEMIIEMERGAREASIQKVIRKVQSEGFGVQINRGTEKVVIAVIGSETGKIDTQIFEVLPEVRRVIRIMNRYKLASREFKEENTIVRIGDVEIGGNKIVIMAGPCAVESEEQILACARFAKEMGAKILRGGAFKPRTSPESFQGLEKEGLKLLSKAREETGLLVVTEVMARDDVPLVSEYADILQIGSRNMDNHKLLKAVGEAGGTVLLKRGYAATIEEWLASTDYLLNGDSPQVILCARGIRTFENSVRFTPDLGAVPVVKRFSHLPIIFDPSHSAGDFRYVPSVAKAGIAAGADGLLIEIHPNPQKALSDGAQSLTFSDFSRLMRELKALSRIIGREI